jgi:type VI secretion system (T6SS) effector Hcp
MRNRTTVVMIGFAVAVAAAMGMRTTGFAQNSAGQGGPPGLCSAQQSCPPLAVGTLQIVDYGDAFTPIYGFRFEVTNSTPAGGGSGGGTGKAEFSDFGVTRLTDVLSPRLLLDAASGRHLKVVNIVLNQGGSSDSSYRLTNVSISRVNSGPELEEIAFTYSRIEFTVGGRQVCYDLAANVSC